MRRMISLLLIARLIQRLVQGARRGRRGTARPSRADSDRRQNPPRTDNTPSGD